MKEKKSLSINAENDMYSDLANQLESSRQNRYQQATQVMNKTMAELDLEEKNEQVRIALEQARLNDRVDDTSLPRALRNPKSKTVTLLQCIGVMLVMLGIQLVVGLPIGSIIAKNAQYEAIELAESVEEFLDIYMDLYLQRYSQAMGSMTLIITIMSLFVGLIWYLRGYIGNGAIDTLKQSAKKTFKPRMIGIMLLLGVGLQCGMAVVAALEDLIVPSKLISDYEETFGMAGLNSIAGILAVVVAAPINEELFFRGIIYRKMKTAYNGVGPVVAAALLFSLMHMIPYQVIYTIPAGFALAMVAKRYDTILPGIIIHMCVNGFSFGLTYVSEKLSRVMNDSAIALIFLVVASVCVGLAVALMKGEKNDT